MSDSRAKFHTINNNGFFQENGITYSNQCMFLSILDYIHLVRQDLDITLFYIRRIVELDIDTIDKMFDIENKYFVKCLNKICDYFRIQINIYYANKDGTTKRSLAR